jgi:hypothetical protein
MLCTLVGLIYLLQLPKGGGNDPLLQEWQDWKKGLEQQMQQQKEAIANLYQGYYALSGGRIDFSRPSMQKINDGLMVTRLKMERYLNGQKLSGILVNTQAVRYKNLTLEIKLGKGEMSFKLEQLEPGGSQPFEVYVASAEEGAQLGSIRHLSSVIEYN